jgi:hypothetical protein
MYYLQSRYYDPQLGRFINTDEAILLAFGVGRFGHNLFNYCEDNPINQKDSDGYIAANVVGAAIGAIIGVVGGVFLGNWLADILNLRGWKRGFFVAAVAALVGAASGAIGYFIGPYVAKIAVKLGQYIADLISKGSLALKKLSSSMRSAVKSLLKQTCCFAVGTKVLTKDGHISIEDVRPGDLVWAENPATGEKGLKAVVRITRRKTDTLVHISTEGEKIATTKEHPFWVVDKGWLAARKLSEGDVLRLQNGTTTKVLSITVEHLVESVFVYNFEVKDWHTYYVSDSNILVHNDCVQNFTRKSAAQIEKMLGVKSGTFHRTIKPDILKHVGKNVLKKVGSNPDILIAQDGTIQIVSTVKKGVSVVLGLNIFDFIP